MGGTLELRPVCRVVLRSVSFVVMRVLDKVSGQFLVSTALQETAVGKFTPAGSTKCVENI